MCILNTLIDNAQKDRGHLIVASSFYEKARAKETPNRLLYCSADLMRNQGAKKKLVWFVSALDNK